MCLIRVEAKLCRTVDRQEQGWAPLPRLSKSLLLAEFNVAFGVYRETICESFPNRRSELDNYLAIISDLAINYGGSLFYEYYKSFSAKAAMYIQRFNLKLDWSIVDLELISRHFTGRKSISCSVCGSFSHWTAYEMSQGKVDLPLKPEPGPKFSACFQSKARNLEVSDIPVCIIFNESVCPYIKCKWLHCCTICGDSHPRAVCPRRFKAPPTLSSKRWINIHLHLSTFMNYLSIYLYTLTQWFSNLSCEHPQHHTFSVSPSSSTPDSTHQLISRDSKTWNGCVRYERPSKCAVLGELTGLVSKPLP